MRWVLLLGALALGACHRASLSPADAGPPRMRSAPVPVQLPSSFDGYVALRGDDQALAQGSFSDGAGAVVLRALDIKGQVLFTATLDSPQALAAAKGFLVREGYRPLTEHPADAYVEAEAKLALHDGRIDLTLGDLHRSVNAPLPAGTDAQVELAGWAQDGKALVIRMRTTRGEFGAATGYVIVPIPAP